MQFVQSLRLMQPLQQLLSANDPIGRLRMWRRSRRADHQRPDNRAEFRVVYNLTPLRPRPADNTAFGRSNQ
jgi:hypothetical protein